MTEREEEENDEFWIGEVEMVEAAYVVAIKEKDAEIAELQCEVDGFVSLSETHQAEIARLEAEIARLEAEIVRLRAALDVFADRDNWRDVLGDPVWYAEDTKHPAEFARKALDGKP